MAMPIVQAVAPGTPRILLALPSYWICCDEEGAKMKWAHPLRGRKIREALADALAEALRKPVCQEDIWENRSPFFKWHDCARWGSKGTLHSWDTMGDCVRYGFTVAEDGCVTAKMTESQAEVGENPVPLLSSPNFALPEDKQDKET
jgi:hypothetical protein